MAREITNRQRHVLRLVSDGEPWAETHGKSKEISGRRRTLDALESRGFISGHVSRPHVTEKGRRALDADR